MTFWAYLRTCTNPQVGLKLLATVREESVRKWSGFLNTELDSILQAIQSPERLFQWGMNKVRGAVSLGWLTLNCPGESISVLPLYTRGEYQ